LRAVKNEGTVYAVDVDSEMIGFVSDMAIDDRGYDAVRAVLAEYNDPLLPTGEIDLIFTCNTYHHMQNRSIYFHNIRKALRNEGRVAIIDFDNRTWLIKLLGHWTLRETVIDELEAAGFALQADHEFLDRQFLLIFTESE
tara:strand:+ start:1775 stop:2194 length:420 start_codon:yes stop_codon:yes gene_type:complete